LERFSRQREDTRSHRVTILTNAQNIGSCQTQIAGVVTGTGQQKYILL